MAASRDTPAMQQYLRFKRAHPDCVLLFRIGDFYEMFDDDAVTVSKAIGLTLTQRSEGIPMAGVPYHQLETYLRKLIAAGFRVAVCEQVQDAAEAKGVIERAVTRVLTPGTLVDDALLESDTSSRLAAVCFTEPGDRPRAAVAVADLAGGSFVVLECAYDALVDELARRSVTEVLYAETAMGVAPPRAKVVLDALGLKGTGRPGWQFRPQESLEALLDHYGVSTLQGFGLAEDDPTIAAAGAVIRYLRETQAPRADGETRPADSAKARVLAHLSPPRREDPGLTLAIDATTLRALEVVRTLRTGDSNGALVGVFGGIGSGGGGPRTAMGKRLLRDWLCRPLSTMDAISARQHAVATFVSDRRAADALAACLGQVQDVTRIAARLGLGSGGGAAGGSSRVGPRDITALGRSLGQVRAITDTISGAPALRPWADRLAAVADSLAPLAARVATQCVESPPQHLRDGGLFRDGIDPELDEARLLQRDAASWSAAYQKRLLDEHQLAGLKVGFNKIFGYYIELTKAQARSAPATFTRKQTLTNAERFVTPELKEFEEKVTTAEARALSREQALFDALCKTASANLAAIQAFAECCAELDVLWCFAEKAARRGWVRPEVVAEPVLDIEQGRHPVLDELLGNDFVPNDVKLGGADGQSRARLALITGPNMAGKSTFIRQTALLVLLAHTGSFVPAARAVIGATDRIFTRVGADDALHAGQSTFMVEMTETARILHHATGRSLVILDEIGRGTSTLDGLALAWSIAETLAGAPGPPPSPSPTSPSSSRVSKSGTPGADSPRTLFATHYHELTDLEERLPGRVINLHVSVREWGESIVFLHRILPGRTSQSYGIHVAKLAGIPAATVKRAREILESLAVHHHGPGAGAAAPTGPATARAESAEKGQMSLFTEYLDHPAVSQLREVKLDSLSPMQAFDELRRLKALSES